MHPHVHFLQFKTGLINITAGCFVLQSDTTKKKHVGVLTTT